MVGGEPGLYIALVYCFRVGILGFNEPYARLDMKVPTWGIIPQLPAAGPCALNILEEGRKPILCCTVIGRYNNAVSIYKNDGERGRKPRNGIREPGYGRRILQFPLLG